MTDLIEEMKAYRETMVEQTVYSKAKLWRLVFSALIALLEKKEK